MHRIVFLERESIIALWETSPGYYDVYSVLCINGEYVLDHDGPAIVVSRLAPSCWAYLP